MGAACIPPAKVVPHAPSPWNHAPRPSWPLRSESLFVDDPVAYDPKRLSDCIRFALSMHLLPELITIITVAAITVRHCWSPMLEPIEDFSLDGRTIRCRNYAFWFQVPSIRPAADCPRWRIQIEFEHDKQGWVAIGVTPSADFAKLTHIPPDNTLVLPAQSPLSFRSDFTVCPFDERQAIGIWQKTGGWDRYCTMLQSRRVKTMALMDFDIPNGYLWIDSQGNENEEFRRTIVPKANGGESYPCVLVCGVVTVTLLPWPDEELLCGPPRYKGYASDYWEGGRMFNYPFGHHALDRANDGQYDFLNQLKCRLL